MAESGSKAGAATALGQALGQALDQALDQVLDQVPGSGQAVLPLGDPLSGLADVVAAHQPVARQRGRPPGAGNRTTEGWRKFFFRNHKSPLLALGEVYSVPVEALAERLQCSRYDAARLQQSAAAACLPFLHQRLPQAVSVEVQALPTLVIEAGPVVEVAAGVTAALELVAEAEGYQQLSEMEKNQSDAAQSDNSNNSLI